MIPSDIWSMSNSQDCKNGRKPIVKLNYYTIKHVKSAFWCVQFTVTKFSVSYCSAVTEGDLKVRSLIVQLTKYLED